MNIKVKLSQWQQKIYAAYLKFRFLVISAGRQSGKTHLCAFILIIEEAIKHRNYRCWWVAPTHSQANEGFMRCLDFCAEHKIKYTKKESPPKSIRFSNGSIIEFRSAEKDDNLRGATVHALVIDEMGLLRRSAWENVLRAIIVVKKAKVIFIGTPKGKNLFFELFCKGEDPEEKDYKSFQISSNESPFFTDQEWHEVQKLPQRVFEQEYEAKFIDDGGEVFRNIRACTKGELGEKPLSRKHYYCGVDLAKSYDFTVISILDNDKHLCNFDRFNDIAWTIQKQRIINLSKKYNAYTLIDSTGLGDPIYDDLSMHIALDGYKFTNLSKRQLIESLSLAIEKEEISFPDIPELINELSVFTFEQTESGLIKYNAPEGMHDDCVISLALANWAAGGANYDDSYFTDVGGVQEYDW